MCSDKFYQNIVNSAVMTLTTTITNLTDEFAAPKDSANSKSAAMAGIGTIAADFEFAAAGPVANGLSAMETLFSDLALNDDSDDDDASKELNTILGSTLDSLFGQVNNTTSQVFNPDSDGNITLIESFFNDGEFLDTRIVNWPLDSATNSFISTMVRI